MHEGRTALMLNEIGTHSQVREQGYIIGSMIEPKVEKISETEFRLDYDLPGVQIVEYPPIGTSFKWEGMEYRVKEVVASNSDNFTFDVTVL